MESEFHGDFIWGTFDVLIIVETIVSLGTHIEWVIVKYEQTKLIILVVFTQMYWLF